MSTRQFFPRAIKSLVSSNADSSNLLSATIADSIWLSNTVDITIKLASVLWRVKNLAMQIEWKIGDCSQFCVLSWVELCSVLLFVFFFCATRPNRQVPYLGQSIYEWRWPGWLAKSFAHEVHLAAAAPTKLVKLQEVNAFELSSSTWRCSISTRSLQFL